MAFSDTSLLVPLKSAKMHKKDIMFYQNIRAQSKTLHLYLLASLSASPWSIFAFQRTFGRLPVFESPILEFFWRFLLNLHEKSKVIHNTELCSIISLFTIAFYCMCQSCWFNSYRSWVLEPQLFAPNGRTVYKSWVSSQWDGIECDGRRRSAWWTAYRTSSLDDFTWSRRMDCFRRAIIHIVAIFINQN